MSAGEQAFSGKKRWLDIVGVSGQGIGALPPCTLKMIEHADTLFGACRFLNALPPVSGQNRFEWMSPFSRSLDVILSQRGTPTLVLASGDPNWFGIGATLARRLPADEFVMHPAPSSFQLAAALLRWPLERVECLSFHGRDVARLNASLQPGNRILALTSSAQTLEQVRDILLTRNLPETRLWILENLGSPDQKITSVSARDPLPEIGDFYVLALECPARSTRSFLPRVPGLPDHAYIHDGQLTKCQVRAATLAVLAPTPGSLLWDMGAGSGSVAIEWMRTAPSARATAIEKNPERCANIKQNAAKLGVPDLDVVCAHARDWLADLDQAMKPDAIFLGGEVASDALLETCLSRLPLGGRLVANAVTLAAQNALFERQERLGGDLVTIGISTLSIIGRKKIMKPAFPVLQWCFVRSDEHVIPDGPGP